MKILFLNKRLLFPTDDGGKVRTLDTSFNKRNTVCLFVVFACWAILRFVFYSGFQGFDDRIYSFYAYHFVQTGSPPPDATQWAGRIGHWLPLSASICLFGFNEHALSLYPLLCSFLTLMLVYKIGILLFDTRIALIASLLFAFFPLDIIYSTSPYADVPFGLFSTASLYFWLVAERSERSGTYAAVGFALGLTYLCRLTAVFLVPPILFSLFIRRPFNWKGVAALFVGGIVVVVMEMVFWFALTGRPLHRVEALAERSHAFITKINQRNQQNPSRLIPGPNPAESRRSDNSVADLVLMFLANEEFGLFYLFVWPLTLALSLKRDRRTAQLLTWLFSVTALLAFFPVLSFRYTAPRDPRYFTCISAAALLCIAYVFGRWRSGWRIAAVCLLCISSAGGLLVSQHSRTWMVGGDVYRLCQTVSPQTVWVSPNVAARVIVYSHGHRPRNLGIHFLEEGRRSDNWHNVSLVDKDIPVRPTASAIGTGFIVVRKLPPAHIPQNWHRDAVFEHPAPLATRVFVDVLRRAGISDTLLHRLLQPDGSAPIRIYRVRH